MSLNIDKSNFIILGGGKEGPFYAQAREDNNGKPGKVNIFMDGSGNVYNVAQSYIKDGFDPKKIIINGQLASDVFQKQS